MHVLALIVGGGINFYGDVGLCLVATLMAQGREGTVYGEPFSYPSRAAGLFELLPLPIGFMFGGFILARWGFAGL
jgi:hypothetical protein